MAILNTKNISQENKFNTSFDEQFLTKFILGQYMGIKSCSYKSSYASVSLTSRFELGKTMIKILMLNTSFFILFFSCRIATPPFYDPKTENKNKNEGNNNLS